MIKKQKIYSRKIFKEILPYIHERQVLVLHGARQVGKTHLLYLLQNHLIEQKFKTYYLDLEDSRLATILDLGVDSFINHLKEEALYPQETEQVLYVLIDEIQLLQNPSSFLKIIVDHHSEIKLIVSGSSSFEIKSKFKESLVGRSINFEVFPLSFEEFLLFKEYTIPENLDSLSVKKKNELDELVKEFILFGGYPQIVLTDEINKKEKFLQQIIDTYIKKDIRDLGNIQDISKFNRLLEVLAEQSGNLIRFEELANTCRLSRATVEQYLFLLENTYIIRLVRPFARNLRSELFKTPKVFFYDTGLQQLLFLKKLQKSILGNVFETAVFAELVKNTDISQLWYWRTKDKKEIDFIIEKDTKLLPIEVKKNAFSVNKSTLEYFCKHYEQEKYKIVSLENYDEVESSIAFWGLAL